MDTVWAVIHYQAAVPNVTARTVTASRGWEREKQDFVNHSSGTVAYIPKPVAIYPK